ncbi:MAG: tRNA uracil 4-sulfurtransferase ThiI [Candidatus Methylomirabilia bacterium]
MGKEKKLKPLERMTPRMRPYLLVHYDEISLKRGNRPLFLRHLVKNLARATADLGPVRVVQLPGRVVMDLEEHARPEAVRERVRKVCGVANVALAYRVPPTLESLRVTVGHLVARQEIPSFRISARRAFKTFPLTSVEINRELGAFVLQQVSTRVDLEHPAVNIHVEVLPHEAFVYIDREPGPGGLPVGVSGTVLALLSGGFDSPVAAWRMIKRGCRVIFVHFHSVPYLSATSQSKARALVEQLTEWQYVSRLFLVPFGEIQREVVLSVAPPARVVVYRRLMVRIAEALARATGAQALVTGESLGQVASQTLANLSRTSEVAVLPVLRPLIGTDKREITAQARALGTFEISAEPDQDCCTLFVPRHPATRVGQEEISRFEARLDVARLVQTGVEGAQEETFAFPLPEPTPARSLSLESRNM